jgi:hypothetical protein
VGAQLFPTFATNSIAPQGSSLIGWANRANGSSKAAATNRKIVFFHFVRKFKIKKTFVRAHRNIHKIFLCKSRSKRKIKIKTIWLLFQKQSLILSPTFFKMKIDDPSRQIQKHLKK